MRILIIRHGDPDYVNDTLTARGWREAEVLADKMVNEKIDKIYVSPLGRAKATASLTLERKKMEAEECDWLREFAPLIERPDRQGRKTIAWDWLPQDWCAEPKYYLYDQWTDTEVMRNSEVKAQYDWVTTQFDALLAKHGYEREGNIYKAVKPNRDTIALFCHFGLECILLSHIMKISPMILWHNTCAAPTSVTTIYTEERREGIASLRICSYADQSHLYAAGEAPSFQARFCETYDNPEERHD